jgi:hypothetical protein
MNNTDLKVFISKRRADSGAHARWHYDALRQKRPIGR